MTVQYKHIFFLALYEYSHHIMAFALFVFVFMATYEYFRL